ncbi:MAG: DUF3310 domain-containing protein [Rhodanobacter sp.]
MSHPDYYGGEDDPYEAIKVIQAWGLNFSLGSVLKYVKRAGEKPGEADLKDLKKARDYIDFEIAARETRVPETFKGALPGADLYLGDYVIHKSDMSFPPKVGTVTAVKPEGEGYPVRVAWDYNPAVLLAYSRDELLKWVR